MKAFIHLLFKLPDGSIWSNIVASFVLFVPSFVWARLHIKKLHRKLDRIHKHLEEHSDDRSTVRR